MALIAYPHSCIATLGFLVVVVAALSAREYVCFMFIMRLWYSISFGSLPAQGQLKVTFSAEMEIFISQSSGNESEANKKKEPFPHRNLRT